MKVRQLSIRDVPGLPDGLTIEDIAAPVVLLLGPNGSGKSTFRRCLEQVLFEHDDDLGHAELDGRFETVDGLLRAQQRGGRVRWTLNGSFVKRPDLPTRERAECYAIGARALLAAGDTEARFAAEVRRAMAGGFDLLAVREALGEAARRQRFGAHEAQELREAKEQLRRVEEGLRDLADDEDRLSELRDEVEAAERAASELASTRAAIEGARDARERLLPVRREVAEREAQLEDVRTRLTAIDALGPLPPSANLSAARVTLESLRQREDEERRAREAVERTRARLESIVEELGHEPGTPPSIEAFGDLDEVWTERERVRREVEAVEAQLAAIGEPEAIAGDVSVETLAGSIEDLENWLAAAPVDDRPLPQGVLVAAGVVALASVAAAALFSTWFALLAGMALAVMVAEWQRRLSATPARVQRESAIESFRARGLQRPAVWEQHPVRDRVSTLREQRERLRRAEATANERARLSTDRARLSARREELDRELAEWAERVGVRPEAAGLELLEWTRRCVAWRDARLSHAEERGSLAAATTSREAATNGAVAMLAAGDLIAPSYATLVARLEELGLRAADRERWSEKRRDLELELGRRREDLERLEEVAQAAARALGIDPAELEDAALEARFEPRLDALMRSAERRDTLRDSIQDIVTRLEEARRNDVFELALAQRDEARSDLALARDARFDALASDFLLDDVEQEFERESRPAVLDRAADLFARFTHRRYDLLVDNAGGTEPEFAALDVVDGVRRGLEQLSDGTRMQLLLSLRIAFAETGEGAERLPIVLDEVFSMSDPGRIRSMVETIAEIAADDRQVIYLGADPTLEVAWREIAREAGKPQPCVVHIDRAQEVARPVAEAVELAMTPARSVPKPDGKSPREYAAEIGAHLPAAFEDAGRLHLFHLLSDDLEGLAVLLRQGIVSLGQWEQLARSGGAARALGDEQRATRLGARVAVARAAIEAWHIGRGRKIGRAELEASGEVSEVFIDNLESLLVDLDGDPAALIEALEVEGAERDERAKRFKKAKREQLDAWLSERGHIDRRHPLPLDEQDSRAREAAGDDLDPASATDLASHLRDYLERSLPRAAAPPQAEVDLERAEAVESATSD
ncbi:hypothetical protein [Engelhardtia mirabilis]|uniref:Rad50/SbcC-type AAA domain-containing protein n=1 Tax=Engelhardtia mirabilis TaxID=2528011 RepID=A0A518BF05_9BACT|nr:hypothetical protein Pla133_06350 [Planctomycetes bacterium Pla133]QDU99895.1 hypothetical protein Pla86_06340 [Planctomycetes bacterium Pla86]